MTFQQKLDLLVGKNNSLLCVGLDSDIEKIPVRFKRTKNPQYDFNKYIIEETHTLVCCYKLNTAFYESHGVDGISELKATIDYIRQTYEQIPILLDFKRGDIDSTNEGYAQFAFDYLHADAVTVQPYMGKDALGPFLRQKNKGIFILCKTSNKGSGVFQDLLIGKIPLYQKVAEEVVSWNTYKNCSLVVGATFPEELANVRKIAEDMIILVPGIGAQGGDLESTMKAGLNSKKRGMIISSSRHIIFSDDPGKEATKLRDTINSFR